MVDEKKQAKEVSKIILKEFGAHQINSIVKFPDEIQTIHELKSYLTVKLSELLENNFNKLINILYRIDISEEKLHMVFTADNRKDIPSTLADLIIDRQLQKLHRKHSTQ